jgi:putative membrane protein
MGFIFKLIASTVSVYVAAQLTPGIRVEDLTTALVFSIILGILNVLVKPFLVILTLPVNILTLGLFTIVINAFMVILTASLMNGFYVESFWSAVLFSIVLSVVGWFLNLFL